MISRLEALAAAPPSGRKRPLLLDADAYATTVLRQGRPIPWRDLAALVGFVGQLHSLLDPDVTWVDVLALYRDQLAAEPELATAMGARSRTGYALRTVLGDQAGVEHVQRVVDTIAAATRRSLVLACPSPGRWLALAQEAAGKPVGQVDGDAADTASMFVAEWIGKLAALPVAAVLFDTRGSSGGAEIEPESLTAYAAVANVTEHLGWTVALRTAEDVQALGPVGISLVPEEFWGGGAPLPDGDVLLAAIPGDATPERVLEQLALIG